jgi:[acyl-carrier-protein] S-malonyltransferase
MPQIAILFTGQGAQSVGMGQDVADRWPAAAQTFAQANKVLGYDLRKLCFEGPAEELTKTVNVQSPWQA